LLLLDGDCLLPPDHVRQHLLRRRSRTVMAGDCCRLDQDDSESIDESAIRQGRFPLTMPDQERRRLRWQDVKARFYHLIRHPTKPKLIGNNIGMWRADFVAINGFDEQYEGWGCEDDDLRLRLRKQGLRVASILRWTHGYHLWHPPAPSLPQRWRDGANVEYLRQWRRRPARCQRGLIDLSRGGDHQHDALPCRRPFVEMIFWPGKGQFSGRASCNVLAVAAGTAPPTELSPAADHCVPQRTAWRVLDRLVEQQHAVACDEIVVPGTVVHRQAG
jgi:GT2 family glycosyltransferase